MSTADAALALARRGVYVFPCVENGKRPLTAHGWKDATRDEAQIGRWFRRWPNANLAIACEPSGLVVIDIDVKDGCDGWGAVDALMREHGELPGTRSTETPSGGCHMYYRAPHDSNIKSGCKVLGFAGFDVRALGGYCIAPPSRIGGNAYAWSVELPTVPLPESWVIALTPPKYEPRPAPSFVCRADAGRARSYSVAALQNEARALAAMRSGRNDELVRAAARLGSLVHLGGIDEDDIRTALLWACSIWPDCNPRKDRDTIERGLRFGVDHPREWREHEAA